MALNKSYVMTIVPDGEGNISITGSDQMSKEGPEMWIAYGPLTLVPPDLKWCYPNQKYYRPVWAVALAVDLPTNKWVVLADGDDPNAWATIDPLNTGVKPKDMAATYPYWSLDYEYRDAQNKKVKGSKLARYPVDSVPDWEDPQTVSVWDPTREDYVDADVTKAKPSTHKNFAGFDLPSDVVADNE